MINKILDRVTERCQHFYNGQPWDQLSHCIYRCTREFENSFERCKEWTGSGKFVNAKDFNKLFAKSF